jgi:hypothetical protein
MARPLKVAVRGHKEGREQGKGRNPDAVKGRALSGPEHKGRPRFQAQAPSSMLHWVSVP